NLGAGKTTFTTGLVQALGSTNRVQSPTFTLERQYLTKDNTPIYHLDLYRLHSKQGVLEAGFIEHLSETNSITIIEWPELMEEFLPETTIKIYFSAISDTQREIRIITHL